MQIIENYQTDVKYYFTIRVGDCWVEQAGFWRGGCLWSGEIKLYNQGTGLTKCIGSSMCGPVDTETRGAYLVSLLEKHGFNK